MEAVQRHGQRQVRVRGLRALAVVAALMLAGLAGYLVRGATPTTPSVAAAHAPAQIAAVTARGLNADSASGYGVGTGSATFSVTRGLNADSASGYAMK